MLISFFTSLYLNYRSNHLRYSNLSELCLNYGSNLIQEIIYISGTDDEDSCNFNEYFSPTSF